MDATVLRNRHLPFLEAIAFQLLLQAAHHQRLVQRFLVGETGGIDGLEARQKLPRLLEVFLDGLVRVVGQFVVVALVAEDGRILGTCPHVVFPLLGKQAVQLLAPGIHIVCRRGAKTHGDEQTGCNNDFDYRHKETSQD